MFRKNTAHGVKGIEIPQGPSSPGVCVCEGPWACVEESRDCFKKLLTSLQTSSYDVLQGWGGVGPSREPVQRSLGRGAWFQLLKSQQAAGASDRSRGSIKISHTLALKPRNPLCFPLFPSKLPNINLFLLHRATSQPQWYLQTLLLQERAHGAFGAFFLVVSTLRTHECILTQTGLFSMKMPGVQSPACHSHT